MNGLRIVAFACVAVLGVVTPRANADEWNQKTIFTFSGPVEIPGQVLPAGTYVFKLAGSMADRNIVEVFNKDENHLYGIFLAIPDYRLKPAGKSIVTFEERASGAPEAVKAWFYPGENYGHDFVYPKVKAMELAKVNKSPVPSMPNEMSSNTTKPTTSMTEPHVMAMKSAPLKAQKPTQEEAEVGEVFPPHPSPNNTSPADTRAANTTQASNMPKELPKTASNVPLLALIGLLSLGAAFALGLIRARLKTSQSRGA